MGSLGVDSGEWSPSAEDIARSNVGRLMRHVGVTDYFDLHRWSVQNRADYWRYAIDIMQIVFRQDPTSMLDATQGPENARWLSGATWNITESCFQGDEHQAAIVEPSGDSKLKVTSLGELRDETERIAAALRAWGIQPGDRVAMLMPMHSVAVASYLAIVHCGASVVGIAESFAAEEIAVRLRLSGARLLLAEDVVARGGKQLPLYAKIREIPDSPPVVVRSQEGDLPSLGAKDIPWTRFLACEFPRRPAESMGPEDAIGVLFSSGTTGEPKAIPWTNLCPLKCGADALFHQDIHPHDVLAWPTSLGWMMGPWLIFASLLNRAAMALYDDAPTDPGFAAFVENAGVTMLGVVPSLVAAWRQSGIVDGRDWSKIRAFSSTGERSNASDMTWLMNQADGKPIIEYCGGTEIAGGYITGVVVRPCRAGQFNTPALGIDCRILDADHGPADRGELFLSPPSIGLSSRLLNRDHHEVYYRDVPPGPDGSVLRRHGDEMERLADGYWRALGRADDTMNLGGIKVSSAEIERVVEAAPGVREAAAVAESDDEGGPSRLIIYASMLETREVDAIRIDMQQRIRDQLNPLFKIDRVELVERLPRTASNKVLRRELRGRSSSS